VLLQKKYESSSTIFGYEYMCQNGNPSKKSQVNSFLKENKLNACSKNTVVAQK
jgi:hypothetical protein